MSNRVEELESKVSELQAAVNGLTEELVETKERVRELEEQRGVTVDADHADEGEDSSVETGSEAEIMEPTPGSEETGQVDNDGTDDEATSEEGEANATGEDEESDIIVA